MMKNILNIDIYVQRHIDKASYSQKTTALRSAFSRLYTFQKVQIKTFVFSEGAK